MRLTAGLAYLAPLYGIRVNCIVPDWIDTGPTRDYLTALPLAERVARQIPTRLQTSEEFAEAVVEISLRENCAGRVVLCRSGRPLEAIEYDDPGFRRLEPF
jgi:NAD(P)-dependent dehydrogenase (short-subunit alcohol dehydrogenase family)